jgi:hypothetical protein
MCPLLGRGMTHRVVVGKPEVHHSENLNLDGRIILKWILKTRVVGCEPYSSGSGNMAIVNTVINPPVP